jgi:hypothetical protein
MSRGAKKKPIKHGTPGGYQVHWNRGQEPCEACRQARREYQQARRVLGLESTVIQRKRNAAAHRARRLLTELHRKEFLLLYRAELAKDGLK